MCGAVRGVERGNFRIIRDLIPRSAIYDSRNGRVGTRARDAISATTPGDDARRLQPGAARLQYASPSLRKRARARNNRVFICVTG